MQFIRNIRLLRNSLKFLTTKRERCLVKMQADKNVIILKESDKAQLFSADKSVNAQQLHGDSSAFESDQHESYLQ
jgi:hypothetical protein